MRATLSLTLIVSLSLTPTHTHTLPRPLVSTFISVGIAKRPSYNVMAYCVRRKNGFFLLQTYLLHGPNVLTLWFSGIEFFSCHSVWLGRRTTKLHYFPTIYLCFNIFNPRSITVIEIIITSRVEW